MGGSGVVIVARLHRLNPNQTRLVIGLKMYNPIRLKSFKGQPVRGVHIDQSTINLLHSNSLVTHEMVPTPVSTRLNVAHCWIELLLLSFGL